MNFWSSLDKIAKENPDTIALREYHGKIVTYSELIQEVEKVSSFIVKNKTNSSDFILLDFTKSIEYIFCMIACLRSGLAFIPIDEKTPIERIHTILKDSQPGMCLTNHRKNFIHFDSIQNSDLKTGKKIVLSKQTLAYLIYTSGSTGIPKGVMVTHSGILNFLKAQIQMFQLKKGSILLQNLSIGFDASISEIGSALLSGNTLVIPDLSSDILKIIAEEKITHICLAPSYLSLLSKKKFPESIETIIIGGEVCPVKTIKAWSKKVRLINVYGPTEATVCTSMIHCDKNFSEASIGKPIRGVLYSIHNSEGERLKPPCLGELWISGISLASGYLHKESLQKQKFIFQDKKRFYKTGDLVYENENHEYIFKGRIDRQFKLHGNLIEPYEIENTILGFKNILLAKVSKKNINGRFSLIAYFQSPAKIEISSLRNYLKSKFPVWMIPNHFVQVKNFEFNLNDKLISPIEDDFVQPKISEIWKNLLNLKKIEFGKSFFELGGDSLKLIELNLKLSELGLSVRISILDTLTDIINKIKNVENKSYSVKTLELELKQYNPPQMLNKKIIQSRKLFLTGATGFLGSEILRNLLYQTDFEIYASYRTNSKTKKIQHPRLKWIEADLTKPNFDISKQDFEFLQKSISKVLHIAADVNLVKTYEELKNINVESVFHLLNFCEKENRKELHFISTLSVILNSNKRGNIISEKKLSAYKSQTEIYGGYAASKWIAERILEKALQKNKNIFIYRCGLLTGNLRDGKFYKNSFFLNFLEHIIETKQAPLLSGDPSINLTPVCYAANLICEILDSKKKNQIFHIAKIPNLNYSELLRILRHLNSDFSMVHPEDFFNHKKFHTEKITLGNHFPNTLGILPEFDLFLSTGQVFSNSRTGNIGNENPEFHKKLIKLYLKHFPSKK